MNWDGIEYNGYVNINTNGNEYIILKELNNDNKNKNKIRERYNKNK